MKSNRREQLISMVVISLALFASNIQASSVVDGPLGIWITQQASPKLGEILTQHPRFKGERIKVMAMRDGHPMAVTDQLTDHIREQLIEDLLSIADVKIVFDDANRCTPIRVDTILGIEVQKHDSREHRVSLAMVDIVEGIWLNGTNVFWHGRLSNSQRRALGTPLLNRSTPTVFNVHQSVEIAEALYTQLQCNNGIETPIFFEPAVDDPDRKVLRKLIEKISNQTLATTDKKAAASIIKLRYEPGEFILEIAANDYPAQSHRIAEVKVTDLESPSIAANAHDGLHWAQPDILSEIRLADHHSKDNVCDHKKEHCVDISFELYQSAYTVIFYTVKGQAAPLSCELPTRQRPGEQHYGLNVPMGDSSMRPTVGFYALAFKERSAANALHRVLKKNTRKCNGRILSNENWVASFKHLLNGQRNKTDWRAIHMTRDHSRTTVL